MSLCVIFLFPISQQRIDKTKKTHKPNATYVFLYDYLNPICLGLIYEIFSVWNKFFPIDS